MEIEDYPPQEPLSEAAIAYQREVMARGSTVNGGDEIQTGPDPYQSLVMFRSGRPNGTTLAFIHGGGWTNGYKEWMTFMAPAFTGEESLSQALGIGWRRNIPFHRGLKMRAPASAGFSTTLPITAASLTGYLSADILRAVTTRRYWR